MIPNTLAMMKLEKNFIAILEKKYPLKPYEEYNLEQLRLSLIEEVNELNEALKNVSFFDQKEKTLRNAELECADVSNLVDYIFERLSQY